MSNVSVNQLLVKILLLIFVPLIVGLSAFFWVYGNFALPVNKLDRRHVVVEVSSDDSINELGQKLVDKGLLKSSFVLSGMLNFVVKGDNRQIKEGEYEFFPAMKPREIVEKLLAGKVFTREVEVEAGSSVWDIGEKLVESGVIDNAEEFNNLLGSRKLLSKYSFPVDSLEGYFAPEKYHFSRVDTPEKIIIKMISAAEKKWTAKNTEAADDLDLTRHDVLTLASIVQKEAIAPEDYRTLASVLYNRSSYGMKLESDATVMYGLQNVVEDFDGTFSTDYRENEHPYNTWTNPGLPPGPICNPSFAAIDAVLSLPKTTYLFWGKDADGRIVFTKTQAELRELLKEN